MKSILSKIEHIDRLKEANWGYSFAVRRAWKETLEDSFFVPCLYSYDKIIEYWNLPFEEKLHVSVEHYHLYEGEVTAGVVPGKVDLKNIIEIGFFDDSGLILYSFEGEVIVAYLADKNASIWVKCAENLDDLISQLDKIENRLDEIGKSTHLHEKRNKKWWQKWLS